jgi:ribonuclease P protein component
LRKTDEISSVFAFKRQESGEFVRVLVKPNLLDHPRLAVVVGKKTAPLAAARNYMKRALRELIRVRQGNVGGLDLVVQVRKEFSRGAFRVVETELLRHVATLQRKCGRGV